MKVRRYLRGSGRVLAFVFVASVVWLLFDMAALRISINDVNSQLLKERVIQERGALTQQMRVTQLVKRRFRHPVQRVEHVTRAGAGPPSSGVRLAQVYRRGGKDPDQKKDPDVDRIQHQLSTSAAKKAVHLDLNGPASERSDSVTSHNLSQVAPGVQEPIKKDLKTSLKVKVDPKSPRTVRPEPQNKDLKDRDRVKPDQVKLDQVVKVNQLKPVDQGKLDQVKPVDQVKKENQLDQGKQDHVKLNQVDQVKLDQVKQDHVKLNQVDQVKLDHVKLNQVKLDQVKQDQVKLDQVKLDQVKQDQVKQDQVKLNHVKLDQVKLDQVKQDQVKLDQVKQDHVKLDQVKPVDQLNKVKDPNRNLSSIRTAGVHRVLSLDLTQSPRDPAAVGQFGQAVVVSSDEDAEVKRRWNEGHFNVHLSDKIPVDRGLPDTRPDTCSQNLVHDSLPSTSVIFCFVDEVWSTLVRSVHSVINRSPPHLLTEIILVDDFSSKDYLKTQLDVYMARFPKVRIIRLKERQGLIRARLAGAAAAKGEVLTFLDSHVECNVGWLEPLLERIYQDRKKVPCPVIEVISDKDMSYMLVDNFQRGIFKWPLVFGWSALPEEFIKKNNMSIADPIRCPVMAGGLFSIDKNYFYELGAYDPGLDVWGGENMEISFKIWMCGGEIEIIPCSRVGHIFRGQNPYKFPKDRQKTVERNLARVAEVWLDEFKDLFYGHGYHHLLDPNLIDIGNLTDQIQLRKRLRCKSFKWYLDTVYPDMEAPLVKAQGLVFNRGLRKCLILQKDSLSFEICDLSKQSQHFNYTWMRHVRQQDVCIAPQTKDQNSVVLQTCDNTRTQLRWFHKSSKSALAEHLMAEYVSRHMCLEAEPQGGGVRLSSCEPSNNFQKWEFTQYHSQGRG